MTGQLSRRYRVLARDAFTCGYCGRSAPSVVLEVDHIMPRSRGGSNHESNLVTACFDCNQGKKANDSMDPLVGRDWISDLRHESDVAADWVRSLKAEIEQANVVIGDLRDLLVQWEVLAEEHGWFDS